ncbi:MAG: septal ring lytic transglycosylase RlpA family lipoprotein [Leptothrix sp. (in: Bacteria)]|nr:septal ring lytic transglycosylase RlpA family lipoprotein [Leptothrix sp. (in: b-proteobacteria)]
MAAWHGRLAATCALAVALALLGGCASGPRTGRDGPPANPPSDLAQRPDAVPRIEPLRVGGPNKPYEVMGRRYVPMTNDAPLQESGLASWYGSKFHGNPTASGEPYDMYAMTAAHKTMPLPSYARVRNPANGREIVVRVNDRGPFADGRVIDLSYTAALKLGVLRGVAPVQVQRLTFDDIRSGRWRDGGGDVVAALAPAPVAVALPASATAAIAPPPLAGSASLPVDDPAPGDDAAGDAGFWLQLGAFRSRDSALRLRQQLLDGAERAFPAVAVFELGGWYRVQAGPYATRAVALQAADAGLRQGGRNAVVIERGPSLGR